MPLIKVEPGKDVVLPKKKHPGEFKPVAREKIDAMGLETICDKIMSGISMHAISRELGISVGSLLNWIDADADRLAQVYKARIYSGIMWDELAEIEIRKSKDPMEFAKARELAHHYRWRAKCVSPKFYGDRVINEHTGEGGSAIKLAAVDFKGLSEEELDQMSRLMAKTALAQKSK